MISKREFFEINPTATEEDYKAFQQMMSELMDRMWDEDHPLEY